MPEFIFCDFCGVELEVSRAFIHHMESQDFVTDEDQRAEIENSPNYYGEPLRYCKRCHESVCDNQQSIDEEEAARGSDLRRAFKLVIIAMTLFIASMILFMVIGLFRQ